MVILKRIAVLSAFISFFIAQNDVDYLRYSRTNVGGSSRFVGMGGAMGALGADMSCASFNPAALGLFTRLDLNLGFGLMFDNRKTSFENKITAASKMIPVFSTFGVALPYPSKRSQGVRNV
ncbi:MAG: hypothetical protein N3F09_10525, partial [Bacteroidia bacterium]|nr:hypothetical protein [Bacteroidia bacterium]